LEGVGEHDAFEGDVPGVRVGLLEEAVEGGFDVDGGDVVGEQQDLVRVQLIGVLAKQVAGADEPGLQQPDDEGAGAGERVEDVDAFVGEGGGELGVQYVLDGPDDEVDDLDGGVHDAEGFGGLGEGKAEDFSYSSVTIRCLPSALSMPAASSRTDS